MICVLYANAYIMAAIIETKKKGRKSIQIDLTPMVDLGFLLITFFMFVAKMGESKALPIYIPDKTFTEHPTKFPEESTLSITIKENGSLFYTDHINKNSGLIDRSEFRNLISEKRRQISHLETLSPEAKAIHLLISPGYECHFEDLVFILDEINICDIKYYAITDDPNNKL